MHKMQFRSSLSPSAALLQTFESSSVLTQKNKTYKNPIPNQHTLSHCPGWIHPRSFPVNIWLVKPHPPVKKIAIFHLPEAYHVI